MNTLLHHVANIDHLYRAWSDVRSQVRHSAWPHLCVELAEIDAAPLQVLRLIQQRLHDGTYSFSPKWGYAKRKSGGSRRGITVQGLRDRIVQRAILNVLFSTDSFVQCELGRLPNLLRSPTSFAGVPGRGVPEAIGMAYATIRGGAVAYAYSDMKDFFPCVPRVNVMALLEANIQDRAFLRLFSAAMETEIENLADLEAWLDLFPITEVGVAQGSLLSTLAGNLCLSDFDVRMNDDQILTIRYLDDFLILAPDLPAAVAGFERAQRELARLGMSCYAPEDGSQKAAWGLVRDGFQFLGCHVHPDGISPSRSSGKKLLAEIRRIISAGKKSIRFFQTAAHRRRTEATYTQILAQIDRKVRGWGDVYRFITNRLPFSQIDDRIDRLLQDFHAWFQRNYNLAEPRARRRMHGVALLSDTPRLDREDGSTRP